MRELKIAYGNSRQTKFWSNKTITFDDLCERLRTPVRTFEAAEVYQKLPKSQRDDIKDKGGFVAGHLKENRRKADHVACRSMLVYDLDTVTAEFLAKISEKVNLKGCYYSTHSHTPDAPRVRLVFPTDRDMTADEHNAVSRFVASELGILCMLDPCSFEPHQLMYWPSVSSDGQYLFGVLKGDVINPDDVLSSHPEWRDCSLLPTTSRESVAKKKTDIKPEDPLSKKGAVGLFCRLYTVDKAILKFLSDIYEISGNGRYTYLPGTTTAGVVVYDDGLFAYSNHATDPAFGKLLNAFDLVRVHLFPNDNPKQSYQCMADFVMGLPEAKKLALKERFEKVGEDFHTDEWTTGLVYNNRGVLENSLHNLRLILEHDPALKNIVFNQLADGMEIKGEVPWKHPAKFWRDADDAQLICYIEEKYGAFSQRHFQIGVTKVVDDRSYHPIKEYLESLPPWDGVLRAETLPIVYLGAEDNPYVRAVTRKSLCAAVNRVYHPGLKFDSMPVWFGPQGIGKSTLISKLGGEWYSDSLQISDMNDKTAAEKLQGFWILEIGELAGMRKADIDKVKAFISRQDDKYRASFGRRVTPHPRQNILIGTTNNESGFLRDITGNRRFWVIHTPGTGIKKPWELTAEDVRQIWAEVLVWVKAEETLYLDPALEQFARSAQRDAMETDDREGVVRAYLEMLLPEDWNDYDPHRRREYVNFPTDPLRAEGMHQRNQVSNIEIWCECFGHKKEDLKPQDSYAIGAIMTKIAEWDRQKQPTVLPFYGKQRIYKRSCS